MELKIRVFIESNSVTIQTADMDTVGHPYCSGTNATDWGNSLGKAGNMIPHEHLILLDAASRAADKLGCQIQVIDVSNYSFWEKRKLKGVIPRIEVGDQILTGLPTSDEIVSYVAQPPIEEQTLTGLPTSDEIESYVAQPPLAKSSEGSDGIVPSQTTRATVERLEAT